MGEQMVVKIPLPAVHQSPTVSSIALRTPNSSAYDPPSRSIRTKSVGLFPDTQNKAQIQMQTVMELDAMLTDRQVH